VSERLSSLRSELLLQSGLFFPLSEHEYDALRSSIERHGVQSPAIIGEHIALVDGRHRLLIAQELGLHDIPVIFLHGMTHEAERELAISLNSARRQMTRAQKRTLIESELLRDPNRSDRWIASICGVHHETVGEARRDLATSIADASTPIPPDAASDNKTPTPPIDVAPTTRLGRNGRKQPASKPPLAPGAAPSNKTTTRHLGYVTCAHGQTHALLHTHDGYRLEADQ